MVMIDDELNAIEERCNAATEGPWHILWWEARHQGKAVVYGGPGVSNKEAEMLWAATLVSIDSELANNYWIRRE